MANRARSRTSRRDRGFVLCSGPCSTDRRRRFFRPGHWQSHRTRSLPASFSLSVAQTNRSGRERFNRACPTRASEIADVHLLFDCSGCAWTSHRALQLRPLSLVLRFRLFPHPECDEGTVVPALPLLALRDSLEHSQNALRRISRRAEFSLYQFCSVWLFYFPRQPISCFDLSRRRTPQSGGLDRDWSADVGPLGARESRRLGIFLSLRNGAAALDVSFAARQRSGKNFRD